MAFRDTFHNAIADLTCHHPRWVLLASVLVTAALGRIALTPLLNIDTDILNQLPQDMPEVQTYRRTVQRFGAPGHLYAVIETTNGEPNSALLASAAEAFSDIIDDPELVFGVRWSIDPETRDHFAEASGFARSLLLPGDQWHEVQAELFNAQESRLHVKRIHHLIRGPLPSRFVRAQMENPWRLRSHLRRRLLATRGPVSFDPQTGSFLSGDGRMQLVVIHPNKPATDLIFAQELMQHLENGAREIESSLDGKVDIGFVGPHAETLYDIRFLGQDVMSTAIASGICVIALFIIAFRRWSALLFVGIPLCLAIVWTLGLVALLIGHLTIVTCTFAAIVLGLGIDFGVHLYNRFLEDRLEGNRSHVSVRSALVEVGPGIFTGAVTTALAFFALLLTDFPGFRELGVIGGTGVLCCLLAMYFVMPSLLMVLHHRRPRSRYRQLTSFGLEAVADAVSRRPRATLVTGLMISAWLGLLAAAQLPPFDDDLFHMRELSDEQVGLRNRVNNRFRLPGQPLLVVARVGPNLQAALEANDVISERLVEVWGVHDIASVDSLRTLLPSEKSQEETRRAIEAFDPVVVSLQLREEAARTGLSRRAVQPAIDTLTAWREDVLSKPALRLSLASRSSLRRLVFNYVKHIGDEFHVITSVYPERARWSPSTKGRLISVLDTTVRRQMNLAPNAPLPLEFTGVSELVERLQALIKRDLALTVFVVTFGILAVLWMHFRSLRQALLVTLPSLAAVLWLLGLMAITQSPFNFINVLALPIIIGLGIDNGIHILERHHRSRGAHISHSVVKTGRAVVITSLSTILGFGALSLASFRGIQQMGLLALVGVALTLITSITLIPAMVETMGGRVGWRGLIRPDAG